ncbi:hypothetical protein WP5S18E01_17950 [Enterobacter cloacae]|nr:hypothetical protein WP5S18E01_17950 [Enterobacter cloacae]
MTDFKTIDSYPFMQAVRPDGKMKFQNEYNAMLFLSGVQGEISHIETIDSVSSVTEKYIASKFWRLIWFVFWLFLFFPMLILWYFMAEVRTRTLYKPGKWFIRLENGEAFYIESIYPQVADFVEAERQRLMFGFSMKSIPPVKPVKDPIADAWMPGMPWK